MRRDPAARKWPRDSPPNAELISQALAAQLRAETRPPPTIPRQYRRAALPDLLIVTDLSGKVINVNPAWSATLGWSPNDLVGDSVEWLIHPGDKHRSFQEFVNQAIGQGAPHLENRIRCKDGSYRLLSWLAVRDREVIYAGARDITDLKQTQEHLQALRNQLAHASHDTPLWGADGVHRARN